MKKKVAIIAIICFILSVIILGVTIYFTLIRNSSAEAKPVKPQKTYTCDLGTFSTNIGTSGRYFKGNVVVETTNKKTPEIIIKNMEPIRDYVIQLIIGQKLSDMTTEEGMTDIKNKIKNEISVITQRDDISNVYFTEYIIQ